MFLSLGKYAKADDYLKMAITVREGIGDRRREAEDYRHLGKISCQRGEYDKLKNITRKPSQFTWKSAREKEY